MAEYAPTADYAAATQEGSEGGATSRSSRSSLSRTSTSVSSRAARKSQELPLVWLDRAGIPKTFKFTPRPEDLEKELLYKSGKAFDQTGHSGAPLPAPILDEIQSSHASSDLSGRSSIAEMMHQAKKRTKNGGLYKSPAYGYGGFKPGKQADEDPKFMDVHNAPTSQDEHRMIRNMGTSLNRAIGAGIDFGFEVLEFRF